MNDFEFYLFLEKNKPKGELLWFALKSKDFQIVEELIEDGYVPAMLEKFKMALEKGCFEQAEDIKEMLVFSLNPDSNEDLANEARAFMQEKIEQAIEEYSIVE